MKTILFQGKKSLNHYQWKTSLRIEPVKYVLSISAPVLSSTLYNCSLSKYITENEISPKSPPTQIKLANFPFTNHFYNALIETPIHRFSPDVLRICWICRGLIDLIITSVGSCSWGFRRVGSRSALPPCQSGSSPGMSSRHSATMETETVMFSKTRL